jgi:hypothetical protein
MGMDRDPSTRPWVFNPEGFLVALLENDDACERARVALVDAGLGSQNVRLYTSRQILVHELYLGARSTARRVVGALTDDQETIELYFGHCREGGGALWIHVPEKQDASRAMRYLRGTTQSWSVSQQAHRERPDDVVTAARRSKLLHPSSLVAMEGRQLRFLQASSVLPFSTPGLHRPTRAPDARGRKGTRPGS